MSDREPYPARRRLGRPRLAAASLCALALAAASAASAQEGSPAADYERLQQWRYTTRPTPLPEGGFHFDKDVASWRLESGSLQLAEPTADGAVTGLVFEGEGRFRMTVPDPVELAQLRRLAGEPALEELDETFTRLVLRTSDRRLLAGLAAGADPPYRAHRLARQRHEHWLGVRFHDADARVVASLVNPGSDYLRVDVKTRDRGWVTFEFDAERHEEIHLDVYQPRHSFLESWLSLDRSRDRSSRGRPGAYAGAAADIGHVEVEARLVKVGKDPGLSDTARTTLLGEFRAIVSLTATRPGLRALHFYLHPMARVESVRDEAGRSLAFLRDHIGGRRLSRDNRLYDLSLLVLLPEALTAGEARRLSFEYELETTNYLPGRVWYPTFESGFVAPTDLYTASLEITTRDNHEIRAMGRLEDEVVERGLRTAHWRIERPVKMLSFSVAKKVEEWIAPGEGLPEVVVFSPPQGHDPRFRIERMGRDIRSSLTFFRRLFDAPLPAQRLYATVIQASHGQAFDGLLHLGEFSAFRERSGPIEAFLAHEVAHQWWGHLVGWGTYRDQWLSEGLAQYSGLMYLEAEIDGGDKLFRQALAAHHDDLVGSIKTKMSPFSRGLSLSSKLAFDRIGPIGHGFRAAVRESPNGYFAQSYLKGALVLHMLRTLVGDEAFIQILRDFARTHRGGSPTTEDFAILVSRHAGSDWSWFFDQWVRRADIPTYRWRQRSLSATGEAPQQLEIEVHQLGVPDGFRMPVPVRIRFADGSEEEFLLSVDRPEVTVRLDLPAPPREVVLNPDRTILARTRRF